MRTLFQKIFFSFLVTIIIVAIVLVLTSYFMGPDPGNFRARVLPLIAENSIAVLEAGGQEALRSHLETIEKTRALRAYLFDEEGTELSGREAPAEILSVLAGLRSGDEELSPSPRITGTRFTSAKGQSFLIVVEFSDIGPRGIPRLEGPGPPRTIPWLRLFLEGPATTWILATILAAGLACYLLARHLTWPLVRMQAAARELAAGNLSTRIGPGLGKRRDELSELATDFDRMADRIEKLVNSQRVLIRDISHELRSPLARLNMALELARSSPGDELGLMLDAIARESNRLDELIDQLLTLSRLEAETSRPEESKLDLTELLEEIVDDAEFEASHRQRHVRLTGETGHLVLASKPLIRSALENVIRNGVNYTPGGSEVLVNVQEDPQSPSKQVLVSVRDAGPGIPEDKLEEVFLPFRRVGEARDRRTGGVGLGLSISKRIVEYYKGSILARNHPEGGLQTEIRLPISRNPDPEQEQFIQLPPSD